MNLGHLNFVIRRFDSETAVFFAMASDDLVAGWLPQLLGVDDFLEWLQVDDIDDTNG